MNTKLRNKKGVIESDKYVNEAFASYLKEHTRPSIIIIGNETKYSDVKIQKDNKSAQK